VHFLSFVIGICLVGVVVLVLETAGGEMGSTAVGPVAGVVVVVGLASLAAPVLLGRSLPCESEAVLASGYRRWFFLQIACAEADALVAFVGYILSSVAWVYPAGVLFSAIGFARLAPTSRHLKRLQEDLSREGCQLSLMSALR